MMFIRNNVPKTVCHVRWCSISELIEKQIHRNALKFTRPLRRQGIISPMRMIPAHVRRPEYGFGEMPCKGPAGIEIKNSEQIEGILHAGILARRLLELGAGMVLPGVTPDEIDVAIHEGAINNDAYPSPYNYRGFQKSCAISVNNVVCHGIPDDVPFEEGDLVNIDVTVYLNGFHGDCNKTVIAGETDDRGRNLVRTAYDAMMAGISVVGPDVDFREIGSEIERVAQENYFSSVRDFVGHGIGQYFHMEPSIFHFKNDCDQGRMKPGMVFTVEPMINEGSPEVRVLEDGWTVVTSDGGRSAQFEHTVLVTEGGFEILTPHVPLTDSSLA
eukprot:Rmarinus@m.29453